MPVTKNMTKSSRVGSKNHKSPPPLRFVSLKDAKTHIKANKLKVREHHRTRRGIRIQVVDRDGKARTLSIEKRRNGNGT